MLWNMPNYPSATRYLPEPVRERAIETVNALLMPGEEERGAIRISMAHAKRWASDRQPNGFEFS